MINQQPLLTPPQKSLRLFYLQYNFKKTRQAVGKMNSIRACKKPANMVSLFQIGIIRGNNNLPQSIQNTTITATQWVKQHIEGRKVLSKSILSRVHLSRLSGQTDKDWPGAPHKVYLPFEPAPCRTGGLTRSRTGNSNTGNLLKHR